MSACWRNLRLYSDLEGDFTRVYVSADDADIPAFNIFSRRDDSIRHFWSGEMGSASADPGQDPRGAPDLMPIWTILDRTPRGMRKQLVSSPGLRQDHCPACPGAISFHSRMWRVNEQLIFDLSRTSHDFNSWRTTFAAPADALCPVASHCLNA